MKNLLEVIEEGRERFIKKYCVDRPAQPIRWIRSIFWDDTDQIETILEHQTSHTKAILTNQIERMKVELKPEHPKGFRKSRITGLVEGHNTALQTQIDYLEGVLKKIL